MSKRRHNFGTKRFKEKSLFIFHARIALKSLILLFVRMIARGARIGKHTHRQDKYCNPRACAPRVNLGTCVLAKCLSDPEGAPDIIRRDKNHILNSDFKILLSSATQRCGSAAAAACVATHTSWHRLWDVALDQGVKGTRIMQTIFKELCRPSSCFQCSLCDSVVPSNSSCLEHACTNHPSEMENLS